MVFMLIGIGLFGGYIVYNVAGALDDTRHELARGEKSDKREEAVDTSDPVSVLILGKDEGEDEHDVGRPDVLIVMTVNPEEPSAKLLSIPRDTRTFIPSVGKVDKINHAYSLAEVKQPGSGIDSTVEAVEELLDIPIDYFAMLNFDGFVEIVDMLGGVDVMVERAFDEKGYDNGERFYFDEGPAHLSGEEALAYVRMRKQWGGDTGRNKRQREVLRQLIQKSTQISNITKIDDILASLGRNVVMNIGGSELFAFSKQYRDIPKENMETIEWELIESPEGGTFYFDLAEGEAERVSRILRQHLNLPVMTTVESDMEAGS